MSTFAFGHARCLWIPVRAWVEGVGGGHGYVVAVSRQAGRELLQIGLATPNAGPISMVEMQDTHENKAWLEIDNTRRLRTIEPRTFSVPVRVYHGKLWC
jgi:hypothetical protein